MAFGDMAGASVPAYPFRHSGAVLVVGFAQTVHDDVARARAIRPDAPIIAVNNAASAFKAIAVFSLHVGPNKLGRWAEAQRKAFGDGFTVHSKGHLDAYEQNRRRYGYVDFWWPEAGGVGTSVWAAARMAKLMGFEERILCGMPLMRMPYGDGTFARDFRNRDVLKAYRTFIKKDAAWHDGVKAMSGWPAKFFGTPA